MSRTHLTLAGAGLAVVAGVAVLYFATRSSGSTPSRPGSEPRATVDPAAPGPLVESSRPRPTLAEAGQPSEAEPAARHDYIDNSGRMVRDHRRGDQAPLMDSKTEPRNAPLKVGADVVMSISRTLRPVFRRCISGVDEAQFGPDGQFGSDAQIQAELLVTIADDVISVDDVRVTLSEGDDPELVACVRDAAAALSLPANGHPEVAGHRLTFPQRLRR